ncbi:ABC transporter ATP-binding protein [Paenibacillus sp. H1-7]|uniref:ABC transporter ATP-binding protein n=1 Tax=Paenibacillus sp. H1-7 TaxID=2282849 RepID=UPI001EF90BFD|nr:ABC transporter ATP-binding protein [Paenibacillus sp. H1-7]ULL19643.1 ABC transporter ATP-binding protein [Paenibacillus sp. H1-7]
MRDVRAGFPAADGIAEAVKGVTMRLHRGEILGLIGETGSGKSVLGLSIPGLLPPEAEVNGSILYKGQDLLRLSPRRLRAIRGRDIALIPQNPAASLNPVLTVGYQIMESLRLHRRLRRSAAREQAVRLLRELNMPEPERKLKQYPFQLSGGMKQRVLAAIGVAGAPTLIIADEPTKGLDAMVRKQVVDLLRTAARSSGASMLVITHDLHVAKSLCDRIGVMYAGRIVEEAPVRELFASPRHPYTRGLLASIPGKGMKPIPGASPGLAEAVSGCAFHPRCQERLPECSSVLPGMTALAEEAARPGPNGSGTAANGCQIKVRCLLYDSSRPAVQAVSQREMEPAYIGRGR